MERNLLILGGTREARLLCAELAKRSEKATISLAGRVERPLDMGIATRVGGFGGVDGLRAYLRENEITHLIDATHPFAAQMSQNANEACSAENIQMLKLLRPPWEPVDGDNWINVPDIQTAVPELENEGQRVMLGIGRQNLHEFTGLKNFFLLRVVDPPETPFGFHNAVTIVDRGPFDFESDLALIKKYQIDVVVSKNSGGPSAYAKIEAARALNLPVIMIERPPTQTCKTVHNVSDVLHWLDHEADRGV